MAIKVFYGVITPSDSFMPRIYSTLYSSLYKLIKPLNHIDVIQALEA